jgi:ferritin-like metal-binding protein YciE
MATMDTLNELLQEELKDIYDAEKQLTKALPKLAKKAGAEELRQAIEEHLQQTEQHVERLEQVFEQLGVPARGKKCKGMQNLIAEGDDAIKEAEDEAARDAVMIAAAQKVEHYEIAAYGTLRTWANLVGQREAASLLEETLEEEKETDQRLTEIAESSVNERAASEEGEGEDARTGRGSRGQAGHRASTSRAARPVAAERAGASRGRTARNRGR